MTMGNIVLTMQASLDGMVTGEEQWMTMSEDILQDYLDYYRTVDAIIVGSRSYASLAEYWQHAEEHSDDALERDIARRINEIPKAVISRSKVELTWRNSQQIVIQDEHSLARELEQMRKLAGHISVESGAGTWQRFIQNGLFDDLWLFVHPVIAAGGERLFALAETQSSLRLKSAKTYNNGVVGLYYQKA